MSLHEVSEFFSRYNSVFDALDGEAVASLWHTPSGIRSGERMTWWAESEPMRENMMALCEVYRKAGYAHAQHTITQHVPLGKDAAFVNISWKLLKQDGSILQAFNTGYNLQRFRIEDNSAIKVVHCIAYEENLQALKSDNHATH